MKQNVTNAEFISAYKKLENAITLSYPEFSMQSVKMYEDNIISADTDMLQKLRLCRNIRNYIQHNADSDSFVCIHAGMMDFLNNLTQKVNSANGICKDQMMLLGRATSVTCIKTESIMEIACKMKKKKLDKMAVIDRGKVAGLITSDVLISVLSEGKSAKTTKISSLLPCLSMDGIIFLDELTPLKEIEDIKDKVIICTRKDVPVGIIYR